MKKLIAIILCSFILMSTVSVPAAEAAFNTSLLQDKIELLISVGIFAEDDAFFTADSETVSKGEFASVLLALTGMREHPSEVYPFEELYNDVTVSTEYSSEIVTATKLGYFGTKVSNYFAPNAKAGMEWALESVMRALGYSHKLQYQAAGLTKDVKWGKYINRSSVITVLYNALDVPLISVEGYASDGTMIGTHKGETLLNRYFDIYIDKGVVLADFYSSVQDARANEGSIRIGREEFKIDSLYTRDLVGLNITYYVRDDGSDIKEIVYVKKEKNTVITIPSNNLEYSYENNNYTTREGRKRKKYDISLNAKVSYNGYPYFDRTKMDPESGYVTLVDNTGDGKIDVVKVMEYRNVIVFGNNIIGEEIQDKLIPNKNIKFGDYKTVNVYSQSGEKTTVESIVTDNVLTIYESPDKGTIDIYITEPSLAQYVDSIDNSEDRKKIICSDEEYFIAADPENVFDDTEILVGKRYIFYLNQWNEIIFAKASLSHDVFWLLDAYNERRVGKKAIFLKGVVSSDDIVVWPMKDMVTWVSYGNREKISAEEAYERLWLLDDGGAPVLSDGENVMNRQLLKISRNKNKEISEIVVAYDAVSRTDVVNMTSDYPLIKMSYIVNEWEDKHPISEYYKDGCYYSWLHFSPECKDFFVNTNKTKEANLAEDEEMKVQKTSFPNPNAAITTFDFYMQSKDSLAADFVIKEAGFGAAEDLSALGKAKLNGVLLKKMIYVLNEKTDEYERVLVCVTDSGEEVRYPLVKEEIISIESLSSSELTGFSTMHPDKKSLAPGDVIAVQTNANGKATGVILLYDYENKHDPRYGANFREADHAVQSVTGRVTRKNSGIVEIKIISDDSFNGGILNIKMPANIIAYNSSENTTENATFDDLLIDDLVVVCYRDEMRDTVVVYRE